jgi:hypothetical protein
VFLSQSLRQPGGLHFICTKPFFCELNIVLLKLSNKKMSGRFEPERGDFSKFKKGPQQFGGWKNQCRLFGLSIEN